jgi:serine/threonine-protein kinase
MQYLEGETLEQRLEREGPIPLFDAVRITGHVARALRKAHARGIVHRDLKPANIYLCRNDEDEHGWIAKVLDFGVAKTEGLGERATTKPGAMLGTPLFMSPEQVQRASLVDHRADLYSLGMCFYNMVTGRYAFEEESFTAVLVAICHHPLPNLAAMMPALPVPVVRWFERCCARNPDDRFQNADEAFVALRAAAEEVDTSRVAGVHDETLRGHRAPLSQRSPPLGTTDSASYPGTQAVVGAGQRSGAWLLLAGVSGVAALAAIVAIALSRFGTRNAPAPVVAAATTGTAVEIRPLDTASTNSPPPASQTALPSATPSDSATRAPVPVEKPATARRSVPKPPTPAPNRVPEQRRPSRRTPTDLGF